jgi:hypothetical protein
VIEMTAVMRVPRTRGALSGGLLVLLGAWGGLIPFIGPYFGYAYTPDRAWTYTTGRLWLQIIPGAAVFLGGLIVLASRLRPVALAGAGLAAAGGAWFVIGTLLRQVWPAISALQAGFPVGAPLTRFVEQIGFFTGLGLVVVFLAAVALGRFTVIGVNDARLAGRHEELPADTTESYTPAP